MRLKLVSSLTLVAMTLMACATQPPIPLGTKFTGHVPIYDKNDPAAGGRMDR